MSVSNTHIESLRSESGESGDSDLVELCNAAIAGNQSARAECELAIGKMQLARNLQLVLVSHAEWFRRGVKYVK